MLLALCFLVLVRAQLGTSQNEGEACVVKHTNTRGVCKLASKCQSAREDFQNNGIKPTFCSHSFDSILVCCSDGSSILNTAQVFDRRPVWNQFSETNNNQNKRLSERKCDEYSQGVTQTVNFIALMPDPDAMTLVSPKCNYESVQLIVGGENAIQGEFPHMAAIGWIDIEGNYAFQCGGSLISSRFVLTAGHCIKNPKMKDPKPSIVRLGDQNLDPTVSDGASPVDIPIKTVHKHPSYKSPGKYNDIALFELNSDVDFESAIRPACLWTKFDFPGHTKAVATGWGVTSARNRETSKELQKVSLTLLENDHCDVLLNDTHNRHWAGFVDSQMCAGELRGGKDTCQGDSGSPLQVASTQNKCIFHIVGITSFGRRCAESGRPAVYTRVSVYLDWIESIVWPGE
ncbi:serine protease snake-like [Vanessa tameamea]|uniref:Serine protease snake-like n=1 Tax=Vanessa tameamea TaxID=334116 RepID=A0A8B8HEF9_VANTA